MSKKVFNEDEYFNCPQCYTIFGKEFKQKILDALKYDDDYQEFACPLCGTVLIARTELAVSLTTKKRF